MIRYIHFIGLNSEPDPTYLKGNGRVRIVRRRMLCGHDHVNYNACSRHSNNGITWCYRMPRDERRESTRSEYRTPLNRLIIMNKNYVCFFTLRLCPRNRKQNNILLVSCFSTERTNALTSSLNRKKEIISYIKWQVRMLRVVN